jgi:hypothetical protein
VPNRLEREFPLTTWRVIPPIGPRGKERDIVRRYVERSPELRGQGIRKRARGAAAAVARAIFAAFASARSGCCPVRTRPESGCWRRPARGA